MPLLVSLFLFLSRDFILSLNCRHEQYHRKIVLLFFPPRERVFRKLVVTTSRLFVGGDKKPSSKRACLRNGVTAPSPRRVGYAALTRRGCARGSRGIRRSVPRKQFGPRKLHQSAHGADGLKAVTFPADVTSSYFTQSVPTPSSCSLLFHDPPSSSTYLPPSSLSPLPSPSNCFCNKTTGERSG